MASESPRGARFQHRYARESIEPPTKREIMKKLVQLVLATGLLTTACAASAQGLTAAQARAAIAPWYSLFNQPVEGDMRTLQDKSSRRTTSLAGAICRVNVGVVMHRSRWSEALPSPSP